MARRLADRVGRYALISSVPAYAIAALPNAEDATLGQIDGTDTTVVNGRTCGPLKALCEAAVVKHMGPARSLLIRPGLVVGPFDPTQRFTWWLARLARAAVEWLPADHSFFWRKEKRQRKRFNSIPWSYKRLR